MFCPRKFGTFKALKKSDFQRSGDLKFGTKECSSFGSTQKKIRRVCIEFSKHNWATISVTICPEMLIFGK